MRRVCEKIILRKSSGKINQNGRGKTAKKSLKKYSSVPNCSAVSINKGEEVGISSLFLEMEWGSYKMGGNFGEKLGKLAQIWWEKIEKSRKYPPPPPPPTHTHTHTNFRHRRVGR